MWPSYRAGKEQRLLRVNVRIGSWRVTTSPHAHTVEQLLSPYIGVDYENVVHVAPQHELQSFSSAKSPGPMAGYTDTTMGASASAPDTPLQGPTCNGRAGHS